MKLLTLDDLIHIDELREEANSVGMRSSLDKHATELISENPNLDKLTAYQLSFKKINL